MILQTHPPALLVYIPLCMTSTVTRTLPRITVKPRFSDIVSEVFSTKIISTAKICCAGKYTLRQLQFAYISAEWLDWCCALVWVRLNGNWCIFFNFRVRKCSTHNHLKVFPHPATCVYNDLLHTNKRTLLSAAKLSCLYSLYALTLSCILRQIFFSSTTLIYRNSIPYIINNNVCCSLQQLIYPLPFASFNSSCCS